MNKPTKYFVMDVDGTLTDGKIYMGDDGEVMKAFNIKDGYGIHDLLPQAGITPVIITGRASHIVVNRCKELGIEYLYQGIRDKESFLRDFLARQGATPAEVAYAGDDLNDLGCMRYVKEHGGLVGAPADACAQVREVADYVAPMKGGEGAVRAFIEDVLL